MDQAQHYFCVGTLYGLVLAVFFGSILRKIRESKGKMGQKNKPLDAFADAAHPNMTSAKVYKSSQLALVTLIFWTFVLISGAIFVIQLTMFIVDNL